MVIAYVAGYFSSSSPLQEIKKTGHYSSPLSLSLRGREGRASNRAEGRLRPLYRLVTASVSFRLTSLFPSSFSPSPSRPPPPSSHLSPARRRRRLPHRRPGSAHAALPALRLRRRKDASARASHRVGGFLAGGRCGRARSPVPELTFSASKAGRSCPSINGSAYAGDCDL
jgi:hypothetical protein